MKARLEEERWELIPAADRGGKTLPAFCSSSQSGGRSPVQLHILPIHHRIVQAPPEASTSRQAAPKRLQLPAEFLRGSCAAVPLHQSPARSGTYMPKCPSATRDAGQHTPPRSLCPPSPHPHPGPSALPLRPHIPPLKGIQEVM